MDSLRPFESDGGDTAAHDEGVNEAPPEIGVDERRMHVRAYNYWASLLRDRAYPSIEDLDPSSIDDFGPHSVLLDFTAGVDDPAIAWLGRALREECDLGADIARISEVPGRSLLSRLTDHYLQIIANQAPVGFEAEFVNQRGRNTLYRGILMPFSSDHGHIDFIYGVINWKEIVDEATGEAIAAEVGRALAEPRPALAPSASVWADGPHSADAAGDDEPQEGRPANAVEPVALGEDATLADYLVVARDTAAAASAANLRSRSALYAALGRAYDFALTAEAHPEEYAELLDDAGIKGQARAPMTPVAKLVFGADYDKTRLTEFATALAAGRAEDVAQGAFTGWLDARRGGLKGVVAEARAARRVEPREDPAEAAYAALREARIMGFVTLDEDDGGAGEFALFLARRMPDGRFAILAPVTHDKALIDRAARGMAR